MCLQLQWSELFLTYKYGNISVQVYIISYIWKQIKIHIQICTQQVILVHEFRSQRTYVQAFVKFLLNFYQTCYQQNYANSNQEYVAYSANPTLTPLNKMIPKLLLCKIFQLCFFADSLVLVKICFSLSCHHLNFLKVM